MTRPAMDLLEAAIGAGTVLDVFVPEPWDPPVDRLMELATVSGGVAAALDRENAFAQLEAAIT